MPDKPPPLPTPTGPPVDKEPSLTKAPPAGKLFPCLKCGAKVEFDPRSRSLKCPYCGYESTIAEPGGDAEVHERDFNEYLRKLESGKGDAIAGRSTQVRCTGCGAMVLLEDKVVTDKCPFCSTHLENKPESVEGMLPPESLIPFGVDLRGARDSFDKWLKGLWFAPNLLKKVADLGQLAGVYIPYWTYDAMTYTHYHGMRGDDYIDTETYTERDAQGNNVTKTRTVTRTNWYPVSGQVQHFFDDVLVCGSKSVPDKLVQGMEPWGLTDLEPFKAEFLAGLKTERYALGLEEGLGVAKQLMEPTIAQLIRQDIGGNHQIISGQQTQYMAITFKHCLLPVWVANYRYQEKLFHILVNGRSGKVSGERPYSFWKIAGLVAAILIVIGIIVALVSGSQKGHGAVPNPQPIRSRRQAVSRPRSRRRSRKANAVVEPAGPPLPELEESGQHAIPPPVRRPRHVPIRVLRHQLGVPGFEVCPIGDDGALSGCPRAEPAAQRPVREVIVRFRRRDDLGDAFDAHLPFERLPGEGERDARIRGDLPTLPAIVIREEREAAVIECLEQHDPHGREAIVGAGGECHRVGFVQPGGERLIEPPTKQRERIVAGIGF
jgi:DNA-directed RNA polymerase subunit RPC12/RpoP